MSVVGATDWYQSEGAARTPTTHDLMLGMYPFAFVQEMRDKLGGMFFLSGTLNWAERELIWPGTGDLADQNPPSKPEMGTRHGTMLPFNFEVISPKLPFGRLFDGSWEAASDKVAENKVAEMDPSRHCAMMARTRMCIYGPEYEYHPAVKSWRLFRNGNVQLELAAVEFSSSGLGSRPSSTHSGSSTFHEGEVSLSPGPETAQSGSKIVSKGEGDLDRLEGMPEYTFRALDFAGDPEPANRTESSLQEVRYPGAKHAVCVGEFSDGTYLYRAGVIIGGVFGGQYTKGVRTLH